MFFFCKLRKMLGKHCTENPPTLSSSDCGSGSLQQIGGLQAYVTGDLHSNLAVLLLSDIHGFEAPNLRKLGDEVGASGYLVVVPDFFHGNPFLYGDHTHSSFDAWLTEHEPDKGSEDAKNVIDELRSRGVSKVGAAGFCWGGMVVVRLAKLVDCIQAAVVLHPGPITVEEIKEVEVPIAILGAEDDPLAPPELLKHFADVLSSAKPQVPSFVKIFPGVTHGWTIRYKEDDEFAVKSAKESHSDMLNWLTKYTSN